MAKSQQRGILMILSPAKTLDLSPLDDAFACATATTTYPDCDLDKTNQVMEAMKKRNEEELGKLLGVSVNLRRTALQYWKSMQADVSKRTADDVKPCIYAFSGTAYNGLKASTLEQDSMDYLQHNLRIIDPLYGVLRPLDTLQPYRLEMATRNVFSDDKTTKLASFWKPSVTKRLSQDLESRDGSEMIMLNLASDEYSAAVDEKALPGGTQYIRIVFWEQGRVVAVHAKRARGLMARYLAETQATNLDHVKAFNVEGYAFVEKESDDTTLVFDRKKQAGKKRAVPTKGSKKQSARKKRESR